ncbi:NAD(P)H-dependent oxidoreductase [Streptococcus saliviloxodontae]|uniref:NADPH-quinone reductase n=1 Tax=Streptococcus saliviloxodontae TaxID=1349416 RepID=A0ABS2PMU5_9STRE|nr:NAD(P)H-dependent oxidoreductase [Streptococcus saliviloxodontae]MBM7636753.1 putative NADPH-quinone reductase [Streptococcus saliviloxodontae]
MKTTIVYNHPYNKSYNHAILEAVEKIALEKGEVKVIDLDAENFNPVMTSQDLLGFVKHEHMDLQAKAYGKEIATSDHLVLIFPIWWELMPAMMKGFIDKVVFPGSFYDYADNGLSMVAKHKQLKTVTIITTMNTPKLLYKLVYGNAIQRALVRGTFKKAGYKNIKWLSLNMVKMVSQEKRQNWFKKIAGKVKKRLV